jgi:cation diffusion facilitator CzcD-associated flavoprotein CzcO
MRLKPLTPERLAEDKRSLEHTLEKLRYTKVGGFAFDETTRKVFDDTAEERNARLEEFYQGGGYRVFFSGYIDILLDQAANDEIYHFWRRKTHERMIDPAKAEILAPAKPPHPFAGKRPSLEQDYYEMMDKPNVTLVDVKNNPVTHLVPNGIVAADGTVHEAEIIVLATGFDAVTGGLKDIDITGLGGLTLQERWNDGTHAYLGMAVSGFPNLFYTYGPFSPSAYANGPVVVESQADWIVSVMRKMRDEGHTRIHPTHQAEREWKEKVIAIHAMTLRDNIEGSWYLG